MPTSAPKILVVDDDADSADALAEFLNESGFAAEAVYAPDKALDRFAAVRHAVVVSDLKMPGMDGGALFQALRREEPGVLFILVTAYASVDTAVELLKQGAYDYIEKPVDLAAMRGKVARAVALHRMTELRREYQEAGAGPAGPRLIGRSGVMEGLREAIRKFAPLNAIVLVTGESGTGKELVAEALHAQSLRAKGPLVKVNCAALAPHLLESELFGHEAGAFTGAERLKKGRFELADHGTFFLDEIGDLPQATQVKLLRVLETGRFERVGGEETLSSDVRLVTATNQDLKRLVVVGAFRKDLFFRLDVCRIETPPLRERGEDFPELCAYFLRRIEAEHGKTFQSISPEALELLLAYPWPGNVRELMNCLEHMLVTAIGGRLSIENVPAHIQAYFQSKERPAAGDAPWEEVERQAILSALKLVGGNKRKAAELLGISERSIYRKLDEGSGAE